jgi:hypothetical protein
MYNPVRTIQSLIKPGQKINQEQEEKLLEKVQKLDEEESYNIYEIMEKHGVFSLKDAFNNKFLAFQLCTLPGTPNYHKFLNKVRTYFDKESVEALIETYT